MFWFCYNVIKLIVNLFSIVFFFWMKFFDFVENFFKKYDIVFWCVDGLRLKNDRRVLLYDFWMKDVLVFLMIFGMGLMGYEYDLLFWNFEYLLLVNIYLGLMIWMWCVVFIFLNCNGICLLRIKLLVVCCGLVRWERWWWFDMWWRRVLKRWVILSCCLSVFGVMLICYWFFDCYFFLLIFLDFFLVE